MTYSHTSKTFKDNEGILSLLLLVSCLEADERNSSEPPASGEGFMEQLQKDLQFPSTAS
jgi:hypothetical protein